MSLTRCNNGHMFSTRRYGNICPYCNMAVGKDKDLTQNNEEKNFENMPYIGDMEIIDPVTGWLVCIHGPQKGRDYRVLAEKNFIGRAEDMHIQIIGDNNIARRNHAVLVYDPKKRNTFLLPGDSSGLTYLNNEAVYTPTELHAYDVIEIGNSKFLFMPLCGNNFEWESEENAKQINS